MVSMQEAKNQIAQANGYGESREVTYLKGANNIEFKLKMRTCDTCGIGVPDDISTMIEHTKTHTSAE